MSVKSFVPDSPTRYRARALTMLVIAVWMLCTYFTIHHPPLVLDIGAVVLFLVAIQDLLIAHRINQSEGER